MFERGDELFAARRVSALVGAALMVVALEPDEVAEQLLPASHETLLLGGARVSVGRSSAGVAQTPTSTMTTASDSAVHRGTAL